MAHYSAIVYAFSEYYPSAQHIGGKCLSLPSSGAQSLDICVAQYHGAIFEIHGLPQPDAALFWGGCGGGTKLKIMKYRRP